MADLPRRGDGLGRGGELRARHEAFRDARALMLDINTTMDGCLSQSDWRVKENANVNHSLGGRILHFHDLSTFSVCPVHGYLSGEHFACPRREAGAA